MRALPTSSPSSAARLLPLLALLLPALSACPSDEANGGCRDDAACVAEHGEGWACSDRFDPPTCACLSDDACQEGAFCNAAGSCQPRIGCDTNDECDEGLFCDTGSGRCIQEARCTDDVHCAVGSLCNVVTARCEPGCHVNGDCALGQVCRCPEGEDECAVGECRTELCDGDAYCAWGEYCEHSEPVGDSVCVGTDDPWCEQCTYTVGDPYGQCGDPMNFCLLDTSVPGARGSFCGVACEQESDCPNGFGCHFVIRLTDGTCTRDADCPSPTGADVCETDADCPGGRCAREAGAATGLCAGSCIVDEGDDTGFCSCVEDVQCPTDECMGQDVGTCGLTRRPCQLGGEQCDGQLNCVNINGVGGCVIGRNCAPDEGITCAMVRSQQ